MKRQKRGNLTRDATAVWKEDIALCAFEAVCVFANHFNIVGVDALRSAFRFEKFDSGILFWKVAKRKNIAYKPNATKLVLKSKTLSRF